MGQHSSQNQALKLVCMHTVFLHAQAYISGCIHARAFKLGMNYLLTICRGRDNIPNKDQACKQVCMHTVFLHTQVHVSHTSKSHQRRSSRPTGLVLIIIPLCSAPPPPHCPPPWWVPQWLEKAGGRVNKALASCLPDPVKCSQYSWSKWLNAPWEASAGWPGTSYTPSWQFWV